MVRLSLQGINNRFTTGRPVKIFVMGKNEWRDEAEWPLSRAKSTTYYLHSDGALSTQLPQAEPSDRYVL